MAKGGFRGGMPGGMNQAAMMKQAQKLQQEMIRMQQEQEAKTFTAKAGGGMVSATVNGKHELLGIDINPEAVDPDDVEMLPNISWLVATTTLFCANVALGHSTMRHATYLTCLLFLCLNDLLICLLLSTHLMQQARQNWLNQCHLQQLRQVQTVLLSRFTTTLKQHCAMVLSHSISQCSKNLCTK